MRRNDVFAGIDAAAPPRLVAIPHSSDLCLAALHISFLYRLIARVNHHTQRVFVLYILTHADYDKGDWKQ